MLWTRGHEQEIEHKKLFVCQKTGEKMWSTKIKQIKTWSKLTEIKRIGSVFCFSRLVFRTGLCLFWKTREMYYFTGGGKRTKFLLATRFNISNETEEQNSQDVVKMALPLQTCNHEHLKYLTNNILAVWEHRRKKFCPGKCFKKQLKEKENNPLFFL